MAMSPRLLRPRASGQVDPRRISGLALWLDAADASTVSLDGSSNVEEWRDKSGNNRHATQTTAANRPDYALTRNAKKVVGFGGSPERLVTASFSLSQPYRLFIVGRANGFQGFSQGFSSGASGVDTASFYRRSTNDWTIFAGSELRGGTSDANWHVLNGLFNGASSDLRVDKAGVVSGNAGTRAISVGLGLGSFAGLSGFLVGEIAEVVLYGGALSGAEVTVVESYLATKWGL